jgi:hypothetical protein
MEYTVEQRVFLVHTYWVTGSIANTQLEFRRKFGVRKKPAKPTMGAPYGKVVEPHK